MKHILFIICFVWLNFFAAASCGNCTEDPDKLYRQGRYDDAQRLYNSLDMDHPEEIRYRYNRGCALYRSHKYQEAAVVFYNLQKNAGNTAIRSRSAYNLGNFLYMMGQIQSAAKFYKKAIYFDPDNEDAQYNLEVMLRMIGQLPSVEPPPQSEPQQKKDPDDMSLDGQKQKGSGRQDQTDQADNESEENDVNDLSGELKSMAPMSERKEDTPVEMLDDLSMDEKKAAAFLDNVKEDRTQFLKSQISKEKRDGAWSRKDW